MVDRRRQNPHAHVSADPENVLKPNARMKARFSILDAADVVFDGKALKVTGYKRISESDTQIVPVRVSPGRRRVPRTVDEVVVVQIVSRNPHQRWVTVENSQHVPKRVVPTLARKC